VRTDGRKVAAWAAIVALGCAWSGPAAAADARRGAGSEPAVVGGGRTMGADELARAGRAVESVPAVTIYQARLADGTLELSDRPPAGASGAVERRSYGLAPQDAAMRRRAEAEREYWRKQADAFVERRQAREREREAERARRERPSPTVVFADLPRRAASHDGYGYDYGGPPRPEVAYPAAPFAAYGASGTHASLPPGAVQGRGGGFIGSGFATSR
jgi:hypothetical protein